MSGPRALPSPAPPAEVPRGCLNCGAALTGPWCAACGQKDEPLDPPLGALLRDLVRQPWADSKVWRSLWALVVHPGLLAREWQAGRRESWTRPVRLYVTASVAFFAAFTWARPDGLLRYPRMAHPRVWGLHWWPALERVLQAKVDAAAARDVAAVYARLEQTATSALPKGLLVLVPLGALLFRALWPRRRYVAHFVFALHVHAFVFLALLVALLPVPGLPVLLTLVVLVHVAVAARTAYGGGWAATVAKTLVAYVAYQAALALTFFVSTIFAIARL